MAGPVAELIKVIFENLANEAFKIYVRSKGIHSELKSLGRELSQIQVVLNDAYDKEIKDEAVKQWLNDLQHLAYDIDDVLDDVATEAMHRELTQESGATMTKVRTLIPTCCTSFSLSHRLLHRLDSINKELQNLEKRKGHLGLIKKDKKPKNTSRRSETSLLESIVVGREGEKEKLINKLLQNEPSNENFIIVPIVGLGGVGKTTLARILYNDTQVKGHFELNAWVCVSDEFDIFKISETIFQSVAGGNRQFNDINQLQVALTEHLKDKRFLLVLDDVWNENYDDWENLVRPFHFGAPGSRVVMTTRKQQLLKKIGFDHIDHLESLSHEDALSLFTLHALGVDNFDSHITLKPYGEGIVKKCGGLPLALKVTARLLRTKIDGEDWDGVLNSEIWDLENGDEIVPALKLSYHDLSTDLQQLFAYCSLFPKGFLFDKEELVLLWMAEGYLNQSSSNKSPEQLGHECFDKLLSRSFFQHARNDESSFVMHDLMNDLATFVAGDCFLRFDKQAKIIDEALEKHRYMSFTRESYVGYHKFEAFKRAKSLRTLLAVYVDVDHSLGYYYLSNKIFKDLLPELSLLRVLSLSHFEISEVPEFIGSLKHLRYLNLSQTKIKELPENVGNLYNLQTLIVCGCRMLSKLPKSFLKLKKLRHFDIRDTPLLEKLPLGIGELRSIQTLTKIIIGGDDGFQITGLKGLKDLHGEISLEGLQNVQSPMHAREANLSLKRITELELQWVDVFDGSRRGTLEKEVLNELKPNHDVLKELAIVSYGGNEFSNWVGDPSFRELVHVSIVGCRKCTSLPPFGQLLSLKTLYIHGMDDVKVIGLELTRDDTVSFPSLEILWFGDMYGWEEWAISGDVIDIVFPCLRELFIENCPNLINISLKGIPSLRVLQINQCGDGVLRSLVHAASSITDLEIKSISGLTDDVWRGVIKNLGAVEHVRVEECNEIRYLWESEAEASNVLLNLKVLSVVGCDSLVSLGEKEDEENNFSIKLLSSLKMLEVMDCDNLKRCCCPNSINIESLRVSCCSSVTHVSFPATTTLGGGVKLKALDIFSCNKLVEKINHTSMPMLEYVNIYGWRSLKSIIHLSNFIHITQLTIKHCPSIKSFPHLELSNLILLSVQYCESLESFPNLSSLTLLKNLVITNCPSLDDSFPGGLWPPKLVNLVTGGLKNPISEWGTHNFPTSLGDLTLGEEPRVTNFSQLSHIFPSSLTQLRLVKFDNLESLSMGLQHLTLLQHLDIYECPKITHLPEALIPSLLSLYISKSPNLNKRCNGKGSHYWPLISHIPRIHLED
ncbi:hypothetical protein SSX86_030378 [Deinandra increscens subsp. villosa]|uniref:NB-ARC n=1 Tax=Deinandra increscens subsp. villosa TaxID=3103831 RepID=A0AAP0GJA0_9ASTR